MIPLHPDAAQRWSRELSASLGERVSVRFSRARGRMVVAERGRAGLVVRLHEGFLGAPADVRHSLERWIDVGRRARAATRHLPGFLDELSRTIPPSPPRRVRLETRGTHHDLGALSEELYEREFRSDLPREKRPAITWGRRGRRPSWRSLELGNYDVRTRLVRVHPVLDQGSVPRFFVRFVLAHELLHAVFEPTAPAPGERRVVHGREFRARERRLPDFERAQAWQKDHIDELLRSARTGRPLRLPLLERLLFD
jgi:hypothetical protein